MPSELKMTTAADGPAIDSGTADPGRGGALRRWNRAVFKVFGPAQLGDLSKPVPPFDPDPACPRCGWVESAHASHRTADGKMLHRCPPRRAGF